MLLTLITQVYRHPDCLVEHRWKHNPYWTGASQFLLSKYQQVQLMEAAAILTHSRSLPSDRALWPSYMSNGALPSPAIAGDSTPRENHNFDSSLTTSFPKHPPILDDAEGDMAADSESVEGDDEEEDGKTEEADVPAPVPSYRPSAQRRPSVVAPRATAQVDIRRASVGPARNHESRSSPIRSVEAEEDDDYEDAYVSYYQHAPPSTGSEGLKWSPPQPAPWTVYEDIDELEMDMD